MPGMGGCRRDGGMLDVNQMMQMMRQMGMGEPPAALEGVVGLRHCRGMGMVAVARTNTQCRHWLNDRCLRQSITSKRRILNPHSLSPGRISNFLRM